MHTRTSIYLRQILYLCATACFFLFTALLLNHTAEASHPNPTSEATLMEGEAPPSPAIPAPSPAPLSALETAPSDLEVSPPDSIPTKDLPFFERVYKRATTAWTDGHFDLYVPLYAWHNRWMYHTGEGSKFNENPWGAGFGRSYYDEDGDMHGLFAMGFKDSNKHFQPVLGYAYIKNWEIVDDFRFGLGVAAGISARHEMLYIPFPAALPLVSLEYANFSIQATYIPERYNHGNVLFTWARWHFD